jgi:hypothetical protein
MAVKQILLVGAPRRFLEQFPEKPAARPLDKSIPQTG